MVGAGNDLKDNLRVAVVKDLEAALSLAEAMRGRDYLQQAGCRFEETEAADIIQQANVFQKHFLEQIPNSALAPFLT